MNNINKGRYAFIMTNIKSNGGFIASDALARALGKQHSHLIRKLAKEVPQEQLSKMENSSKWVIGQGAEREKVIYLLPDDIAVGLAMSYSMTIGQEVYQAFKEILRSQFKILNANALAEAQRIALEAIESHRKLVYLGDDLETENDNADVARARLNRRAMPDDM